MPVGELHSGEQDGELIHELCHWLILGNRSRLRLPPYRPNEHRENAIQEFGPMTPLLI